MEQENHTSGQVGLVNHAEPGVRGLEIACGGFSMAAGQSGPWEGRQGYNMNLDPVTLFGRVWDQVQSYSNAIPGIRAPGATTSGGTFGYAGSSRWQEAERQYLPYKPELDRWEGRFLSRELIIAQREEAMFRAAV